MKKINFYIFSVLMENLTILPFLNLCNQIFYQNIEGFKRDNFSLFLDLHNTHEKKVPQLKK